MKKCLPAKNWHFRVLDSVRQRKGFLSIILSNFHAFKNRKVMMKFLVGSYTLWFSYLFFYLFQWFSYLSCHCPEKQCSDHWHYFMNLDLLLFSPTLLRGAPLRSARNLPSTPPELLCICISEGLHRILRGLAKFTFLFTYVQQWSHITVYGHAPKGRAIIVTCLKFEVNTPLPTYNDTTWKVYTLP